MFPTLILASAALGQVNEATLSGHIGAIVQADVGAAGTDSGAQSSEWRGACREPVFPRPDSPDPDSLHLDSVRLLLREISTSRVVQETRAQADGRYRFRHVAFAAYTLEAWNRGRPWASRDVKIEDASPDAVDLPCPTTLGTADLPTLPDRVVRARSDASPLESIGHDFYASEDILALILPSREKAAEALLLQSADMVPDEDGRMHARGEDAQIQYIVDGIPWSGNPTRIYSSLFHADMAKSVDVLTGGLPARYGAGSAVVTVSTRDGLDRPFAVRAGAGAATHGTQEADVLASGRLGAGAGLIVGASRSRTDRYLDPISGFDAIHDGGHGNHAFAKLTTLPMENMEVRLMGAYDASAFDIPNLRARKPGQALGQDQGQELGSYLLGARVDADPIADVHVAAALYSRGTQASLKSGGLSRLSGNGDSLLALSENERFFLGARREDGYHGGELELLVKPILRGRSHRLRAGVSGEVNPLSESFAFAVTDSSLSGPDGDPRLLPYDISRGGKSLVADETGSGWAASAYVEDGFDIGKWSFLPGLRYDVFSLFRTEQALSPRLAASYAYSSNLDLRLSIDWLAARAPLENILLASSPALLPLSGSEQDGTPATVGSERAVVLDLGADWRLGRYLVFDGGVYGKYIRDFLVKSELGNSGLIFPINLKRGLVAGGKVEARLREWHRLSGTLSVGSCVSLGLKPDDGSSPIAAGLLVGEEGQNYGHPFSKEDAFPTEHNQIATAVVSLRYRLAQGLMTTLGGRFDSGLPFDLNAADGSGLDAAQSRAELKRRGYGDDVIDLLSLDPEAENPDSPDKSVAPHAVFDLGLEYKLPRSFGPALGVRAAVLNVLDTPYLYKFESSFGSTHFGQPRTLGLWVSAEY